MPRTFQDTIRLDFEITSKGKEHIGRLAKDLDKITKSINKLNNLGGVLDAQSKKFESLDKRIKDASKRINKLGQNAQEAGKKGKKGFTLFGEDVGKLAGKIGLFATLTAAIVKTLGFIADRVRSVSDIEESMARVATVTRATDQSMSKALFSIRREVFLTARDVKLGFADISVAAFAAGSAGLNVAQQMASIRPITNLVVGTLGDMEFTAKLVTGSFNVFSEKLGSARTDLEKFQAIADTIADTFSRQQIELSELEAGFRLASSAASILDVDFNELVTTLGFLNTGMLKGSRAGTALLNAFIKLAKNSDRIKESFNVSFDPTQPLKFKDTIIQVAEQLEDGGVSAEEFRKLIEIFGIRGARAIAQIVNNMERYRKAVGRGEAETKDMAAVLSRIQTATLVGSFEKLKNSLGESLTLLNDILPVTRSLSVAFNVISIILNGINDALSPIAKITGGFFDKLGLENQKNRIDLFTNQLEQVDKRIDKIINKQRKKGLGIDFDSLTPLLERRKALQDELRITQKLVKTREGIVDGANKERNIELITTDINQLILQLDFVKEKIKEVQAESRKTGVVDLDTISPLLESQKKLEKTLASQEKTLKKLKNETQKIKSDTEAIPESVRMAAEEMERFVKAGEIARSVNGDIFGKVFEINSIIQKINGRVQKNKKLSDDVKNSFSELKVVISDNLNLDEKRLENLEETVKAASKHVAAEKEVQDILKLTGQLIVDIGDKRKETAEFIKETLRDEKQRVQLEQLRLMGFREEIILRKQSQLILESLNSELGTNLTLDEARKMTSEELLRLAGENAEAQKLAAELVGSTNDEWLNQVEVLNSVINKADELAKKVNEAIKDTLIESIKKADSLGDAFEKVADKVGDIIVTQQLENIFDKLFQAFDIGGFTVESQIGRGGDILIQKLEAQVPAIFTTAGDIIVSKSREAAAILSASGIPGGQEQGGVPGLNELFGKGKKSQVKVNKTPAGGTGDFTKLLGNVFSGGLAGATLAKSRGLDNSGQVGAAIGGAIGNAILPGIGGVVGGFLGGMFGKKKKEEPKKKESTPFKLDVANTHLNNINRHLVGLRQDTQAFALQSSFYFAASNQNPLSRSVTFAGDFIFNGAASSGSPGDVIGQFEQSMTNILEEQINRGAQ